MKYELTAPEKATMKSLREKGEVFGLYLVDGEWVHNIAKFDNKLQYLGYRTFPLTEEAAHALAIMRGLKELGEKWGFDWRNTIGRLALNYPATDMLAALIAALGDKR